MTKLVRTTLLFCIIIGSVLPAAASLDVDPNIVVDLQNPDLGIDLGINTAAVAPTQIAINVPVLSTGDSIVFQYVDETVIQEIVQFN